MRRKPKQYKLPYVGYTLITTVGKTIPQIVDEMLHRPIDAPVLLDLFVGYERGDYRKFTDDELDLKRLQSLLNSCYHGKRFNFLGDDMIAQMIRKSIAEELWKPKGVQ